MYLNEATLLNNVRVRYNKDHIYVRFLFLFSPPHLRICFRVGINPLHLYGPFGFEVLTVSSQGDNRLEDRRGEGCPFSLGRRGEDQVVKREG